MSVYLTLENGFWCMASIGTHILRTFATPQPDTASFFLGCVMMRICKTNLWDIRSLLFLLWQNRSLDQIKSD